MAIINSDSSLLFPLNSILSAGKPIEIAVNNSPPDTTSMLSP